MEVKLYKKDGKVIKAELNGKEYTNIKNIRINNNYKDDSSQESIVIEFSAMTKLEIVDEGFSSLEKEIEVKKHEEFINSWLGRKKRF